MISGPQETNERGDHLSTSTVCIVDGQTGRLGVKKIVIGVNEVMWQSPRPWRLTSHRRCHQIYSSN